MSRTRQDDVAIGIVREGDRFLVGQRPAGGPLAGLDEFPGGKCLPAETPERCVVRECLEETGLAVTVVAKRQEIVHQYEHARVRLNFFDCEVVGPREPKPPFRWVKRNELSLLQFPEANQGVIEELLSHPFES